MNLFIRLNKKGASLIEILLVIVTLSAVAFLISNIPNSFNLVNKSKNMSIAREIATKVIEDTRSTLYSNITNGTTSISDSRINLLPSASGTILIEDCPESVCGSSLPVKQIRVTLNWKEAGKDAKVSLITLISQGGLNQ